MPEPTTAERNARVTALGSYNRWLAKRFKTLDLVEMAKEMADPISLRQVFVPMRAATEDVRDETFAEKVKPADEELPGEAVWDLLVREPFLMLSGRPGSGKTTLVHATILELSAENGQISTLRSETRAIAVPFILRELKQVSEARSLEDLARQWWPRAIDQASEDKIPLDQDRLQPVLFPSDPAALQEQPVLLLFDGIDEIGGPQTRRRLMKIARMARDDGYRVVVTGRPGGYEGLGPIEPAGMIERGLTAARGLELHHLQPFAWPQIKDFIERWYTLRGDWKRRKVEGTRSFLAHLADPHRRSLLVLARRPIFLALMALVNCTENQMPEGRARLYERIVDLYLTRQELHRQHQWTLKGETMPRWPEVETRLVLSHLAWQSQLRIDTEKGSSNAEFRRVIWDRDDAVKVIRDQLEGGPGRFGILEPGDAEEMLRFFLHPAGLLVEPEEGRVQFAHLSFQEYLCALFLQERRKVSSNPGAWFREQLLDKLELPGWDEVGILYLCIHAASTGNEGHFELLGKLDPANVHHAALLVAAVAGRELPFMKRERKAWLPVAVACALLHPERQHGTRFRSIDVWQDVGLQLELDLLRADDDAARWALLQQRLVGECAGRLGSPPRNLLHGTPASRWENPPDDESWGVDLGPADARCASMLRMVADSGWRLAESELSPIADEELERALCAWLGHELERHGDEVLWTRIDAGDRGAALPVATDSCLEFDRLVPATGALWRLLLRHLPTDAIALQSDWVDCDYFVPSQPVSLLLLYPRESLGGRSRAAIGVQQVAVLGESAASGGAFADFLLSLSLSRSRSRSRSLSLSRSRSLSLSRSLSRSLVSELPFSIDAKRVLSSAIDIAVTGKTDDAALERFVIALELTGLRHAAHLWFDHQANDPDMMRRRGFEPGIPLPPKLGLFDESGRPHRVRQRESYVRLRTWVEDHDAFLEFLFPDGPNPADREIILADLKQLQQQPWSMERCLDAVLADWPADEEERDLSVEAMEPELVRAAEALLEAHGGAEG